MMKVMCNENIIFIDLLNSRSISDGIQRENFESSTRNFDKLEKQNCTKNKHEIKLL